MGTLHRSGAWGSHGPVVPEILARYAAETRAGSVRGLLETLERQFGTQQRGALGDVGDTGAEDADGWVTACGGEDLQEDDLHVDSGDTKRV